MRKNWPWSACPSSWIRFARTRWRWKYSLTSWRLQIKLSQSISDSWPIYRRPPWRRRAILPSRPYVTMAKEEYLIRPLISIWRTHQRYSTAPIIQQAIVNTMIQYRRRATIWGWTKALLPLLLIRKSTSSRTSGRTISEILSKVFNELETSAIVRLLSCKISSKSMTSRIKCKDTWTRWTRRSEIRLSGRSARSLQPFMKRNFTQPLMFNSQNLTKSPGICRAFRRLVRQMILPN